MYLNFNCSKSQLSVTILLGPPHVGIIYILWMHRISSVRSTKHILHIVEITVWSLSGKSADGNVLYNWDSDVDIYPKSLTLLVIWVFYIFLLITTEFFFCNWNYIFNVLKSNINLLLCVSSVISALQNLFLCLSK